jgi:hypothetical protein
MTALLKATVCVLEDMWFVFWKKCDFIEG